MRRRIAMVALAVVVGGVLASQATAGAALRTRIAVTDMTQQQRLDYVQAVLALKSTPSPFNPRLNYYDQFVAWHQTLSECDISDPLLLKAMFGHGGPMFLPWHRQFLLLFEDALRDVSGKDVTVPYWDWTDPASTQAVFSAEMMGGNGNPSQGYAVTTGPFRKGAFKLAVHPIGLEFQSSATTYLTRNFSTLPGSQALPTAADVASALAIPNYDVPPYNLYSDTTRSFRNNLEGFRGLLPGLALCGPDGAWLAVPGPENKLHNVVHGWVGGVTPGVGPKGLTLFGTMVPPSSSVNDPVFFLHHSNVDRLWAEWQQEHGVDTYRPLSGYPKNSAGDVMPPFDGAGIVSTPETVADVAQLGYSYAAPGQSSAQASRLTFATRRSGRKRSVARGLWAPPALARMRCDLPIM